MDSTDVWHRFGLKASPFETSPTPEPFTDGSFRRLLDDLRAAIDERRPFVVVIGRPGSGRSTLTRAAIAGSSRAADAAWLPGEAVADGAALSRWLLARVAPREPEGGAVGRRLLQRLRDPAGTAGAPLIVADDVEAMPASVLDELFQLVGAAAPNTPPLSLLMIVEPLSAVELGKAAAAHAAPALVAELVMPSLELADVAAYVAHRLAAAGYAAAPPFTADALARIANISRGQPLRINQLCEACFKDARPSDLPLGSERVMAALATLLAGAGGGGRWHDEGRAAMGALAAVEETATPATAEPEDERLEALAGRVNAALHRSFQRRVAEQAESPPAEPPVAPPNAGRVAAPVPVQALAPEVPPQTPAPTVIRARKERPQRRSRRGLAFAAVLLIAGAGAAFGWLSISRWWAKNASPSFQPATTAPAPVAALPPEAAPVAERQQPPPRVETSPPGVESPSPAAAPSADSSRPEPADTAAAPPPPVVIEPRAHDPAVLMARGQALLQQDDVAAAQLFFNLAAEQGSPAGAMAMAASCDPIALKEAGIRGARANPGEALTWYRRAAELGEASAEGRRDRLLAYLRKAAADGDAAARATLESQH